MDLFTSWHAIIMALLPGLIAFICKPDWPGPLKFVIALAVCFVAAMVELLITGTVFTFSNLPAMFAQVSALVFGSYAALWKRFDFIGKMENGGNV